MTSLVMNELMKNVTMLREVASEVPEVLETLSSGISEQQGCLTCASHSVQVLRDGIFKMSLFSAFYLGSNIYILLLTS